jgi:hypothetical protein
MMKMTKAVLLCSLVVGAGVSALADDALKAILSAKMLPDNAGITSYTTVFNEIEAADAAADAAWRNLSSREAYETYRRQMHARMVEAIGGFPSRTPLNAKTVDTVVRDGYRVEKVLFESLPGVFVTGLLYLPDEARFKPPYPAFLVTCGHSGNGKGSGGYQRACAQGALQGFAAFIYDPISQGERMQEPPTSNVVGHNVLGVNALLMGRSMAQLRIWDGMRSIDYLQSRPDIRADAIGYMGNSGGGTMTSLIMAIDPRVKAAAPSCYISSIREVVAHCGPQDAEQNIFGQLTFGLNHASFVLMQGQPVRLHCCHNDFFPFEGSRETIRTVKETAARLGLGDDRYGITDVPGPHGWRESTRVSSVQWMRRWLMKDETALPIDVAACRRLDVGFNLKAVDAGLTNYNVTANGKVSQLPGFRSVYEYIKDDLAAALKNRTARSAVETEQLVRRVAKIRLPDATKPVAMELSRTEKNGWMIVETAFQFAGGLVVPAVTVAPRAAVKTPVLLAGDQQRAAWTSRAASLLAAGHPVTVVDVIGTGEIGQMRHRFYNMKNPDEEIAVLYYMLGRSLVAERAEELLAVAAFLKEKFREAPHVVAGGRVAVAAAHAYGAAHGLVASVETVDAPASWTEVVQKSLAYPYAVSVHGALCHYDWTDLLK